MAKRKLTVKISYRIDEEEFRQIQRLVAGTELSAGDWCREAAREKVAAMRPQASRAPSSSMTLMPAHGTGNQTHGEQLQKVGGMTNGEMILFHEVIRLRWFFQESLRYMGRGALTPDNWNHLIDQVNKLGGFTDDLASDWLVKYGVLKPKPKN